MEKFYVACYQDMSEGKRYAMGQLYYVPYGTLQCPGRDLPEPEWHSRERSDLVCKSCVRD